jgi:L-iditol 2-dehydrogenase
VDVPVGVIQNRELELHGVFRYANTWPTARALAERGLVDLDGLVTCELLLASVGQALASANDPGSIKTMIGMVP